MSLVSTNSFQFPSLLRIYFLPCGSCMRLTVTLGLDLSYIVTSVSFNIEYQSHAAFCKHEPAVCNLLGSHYLIRGYQEFFFFFFFFSFPSSSLDPPPCNITSCSFNICLEKRLNCSAQTHTDTRMEFTQRNEAVRSYWKQTTTTGDGEERERHTDRGFIHFVFFVFCLLLPLPHPFLSPHLVGLDSSLQVLDPFVSLCSWATRKALGSRCRSHLRL